MKIVGRRITLRFPIAQDAPALLAAGSDPAVTRFFSWGPYQDVSEPLRYIAGLAGERDRGERLEFVVEHADHGAIGITGLSEVVRRDRRAVVGTWLGRDHWGTGANREAKALIAKLAFDVLGLERLGAYADLDNPRSQAALASIGFTAEGRLRRFHRHGEHVHDVLLYSWLREEWIASPLAREPAHVIGQAPPAFGPAAAGGPAPAGGSDRRLPDR